MIERPNSSSMSQLIRNPVCDNVFVISTSSCREIINIYNWGLLAVYTDGIVTTSFYNLGKSAKIQLLASFTAIIRVAIIGLQLMPNDGGVLLMAKLISVVLEKNTGSDQES